MNAKDRAGYILTGVIVLALLAVMVAGLIAVTKQPPRCERAFVAKVSCEDQELGDACFSLPPCPNKSRGPAIRHR